MNAAIGFTAAWRGKEDALARAAEAQQMALRHFPDLKQHTLKIGETTLYWWGRGAPEECARTLADQSVLLLNGSPVGGGSWEEIERAFVSCGRPEEYRLPWDGRVNLLHISADGKTWRMWNDFVGAVPVFYSTAGDARLMSTLEPVVAAANNFSQEDFHLPGMMAFLLYGHSFGEWTLFRGMKKVLPDCFMEWSERGTRSTHLGTIYATQSRMSEGWDHLIDELHELLKRTIDRALSQAPVWILPLSSGLDSRMIAVTAAETGHRVKAFTWGPPSTKDSLYAQAIAKQVGIPWQHIDLGEDYLAEALPVWRDLFGSAMHFHGMYQIPFYNALRAYPPAPIASGFLNDLMSGIFTGTHPDLYRPDHGTPYTLPESWMLWTLDELNELVRFPIDEALQTVTARVQEELDFIQGEWFQKLNIMTLRGRQHHFTYFQSMLCDYWRGVSTPYLDRSYVNFWLSLPRLALDYRKLMVETAKRYYSSVMGIPGTFAREPAILTGRYLVKRRLSQNLPDPVVRRLLPEFTASKHIQADVTSMQKLGERAIWPIPQTRSLLSEWFQLDVLDRVYQEAIAGDLRAVRKMQTIQTLAYRMN